ncbi:MAG TPA: RDD family protein [Burkholderiaceae bacterium]|nr:RDD family protein [Burkholderiaceae bacterium]
MNTPETHNLAYAGFWVRVGASLIDSILLALVTTPLLVAIYGWAGLDYGYAVRSTGFVDILVTWILPVVAVIWFWVSKQATPGKMLLSLRVVDAKTGQSLSVGQSIARYLGYFVSTIPFGLGLLWVGFDSKKQGWHDKIAGTVVVRSHRGGTEPVRFDQA